MQPADTCQACRRHATPVRLTYRKGSATVCNEALLQCDVCERYACADCLEVYNIFSGYDFLCHTCAQTFGAPPPRTRGH
jgi:hypothetical protein